MISIAINEIKIHHLQEQQQPQHKNEEKRTQRKTHEDL